MSSSSSFRDVHTFDGIWKHDINTRVSNEDKVKIFNWLLENMLSNDINSIDISSGIQGLKLVINNTQQQSNYDPTHKVYADDILAEIVLSIMRIIDSKENDCKEKTTTIIKQLLEQMGDMYKLGTCPQGRSARLIQIYKFIE